MAGWWVLMPPRHSLSWATTQSQADGVEEGLARLAQLQTSQCRDQPWLSALLDDPSEFTATMSEWLTGQGCHDSLSFHLECSRRLIAGWQASLSLSDRPPQASSPRSDFYLFLLQSELDLEKGLEMRKWVLSGILASEETYLSHLEALLLVRRVHAAVWGGAGAQGALCSVRTAQAKGQLAEPGGTCSLEAVRHLWEGWDIPPV